MMLFCEVYKLGSGSGKRNEAGCGVWRSCVGQNFTFLSYGVNEDVGYTVFWDVMCYPVFEFGIRAVMGYGVWGMGYGIMKIVHEDVSGGRCANGILGSIYQAGNTLEHYL